MVDGDLSSGGSRRLAVDASLKVSAASRSVQLTPREAFNFAQELIQAASRAAVRQGCLDAKTKRGRGKGPSDNIRRMPARTASKRNKAPTRFRRLYG